MNLTNFFRKFEHGAAVAGQTAMAVAPLAIPILSAFEPALAPLAVNLYNDALMAESTWPDAKTGPQKQAFVLGQFANGLAIYQAATGKAVDASAASTAAQTVLTSMISGMNALAAMKDALAPTVKP